MKSKDVNNQKLDERASRETTTSNDSIADATSSAGAGEVGPNGHRVGYTKEGDKVEWIPDDDAPDGVWPLVLRRGDKTIGEKYGEFWDMVWWNRHLLEPSEWTEKLRHTSERAIRGARLIREEYGKEMLEANEFEWVLLQGKLSALAWVMGCEWEGSLDM